MRRFNSCRGHSRLQRIAASCSHNWKKGSRCDRTARWLGGEPFWLLLSRRSFSVCRPRPGPRVSPHLDRRRLAGLIKHLAQGSFVLPASLAGGHIGGIAVDTAGNIYAAIDRLQKPYVVAFDANGTYLRSWQAGSGTGGIYRIPLTIGADGLIYIIPEESVDTVKVFTTAGTLVRQFGAGSHIRVPSDIEVDQSGNVYVTSFPNPAAGIQHDVVTRLNPSGAVTGQWQPLPGGGVAGGGSPPKLRGIAVEPGGSMWVTTADLKGPVDPSRRQRQAAQDRGTPRSSFPAASRMSSGTSTTPMAGSTSAARSAAGNNAHFTERARGRHAGGEADRRGRRERSLRRCRRGTCLPERKGSRAVRHRRALVCRRCRSP